MRLELGRVLFGKFLWIDFLTTFLLFWDLVSILVKLFGLGGGFFWRDVEYLITGCVAERVAIENVSSILAVVLAQSPAESLTHHLLRNLLLSFVVLVVLIDLSLDIKWDELVIRGSLVLSQLLKLTLVVLLALVLDITSFTAFFASFSASLGGFLTFALFSCPLNIIFLFLTLILLFSLLTAHFGPPAGLFLLLASDLRLAGLLFKSNLLSCTVLSKLGQSDLLALPVMILCLFLFVPVLNVVEDLLFVNVRHTVVLGKLSSVEGLATAGFARDANLEGLEATLLAELLLDSLDVGGEAVLAVPLEATIVTGTFLSLTLTFFISSGRFGHENFGGECFYVQHDELLPVQVQVKRGLLWMHGCVLHGDINRFDKACANTIRDGLNQLLLGRSLSIIDTKDVLGLRWRLKDFLNHPGQILHVDRRHEVLALAHDGQFLWILLPRSLEMVVEDGFTKTVKNAGRDDEGPDPLFLEVENPIFNLLNLSVLSARLSLLVVTLGERMMNVLLSLRAFHLYDRFRLLNLLFLLIGLIGFPIATFTTVLTSSFSVLARGQDLRRLSFGG